MGRNESENRPTLEALVAALNSGDLEVPDRVSTDDVVMQWPESGEHIVMSADLRALQGLDGP